MVDTYQVFVALDATALEGGQIYIGQPNADPQVVPLAVFWDSALTVPATQPLRTSGGVIVRDGTPADVFAGSSAYSIRVLDRSGTQVWYKSTTGGLSATRLTFPIPTGPAGADSFVPGPANSTFSTLALMKAAPATNRSYTLAANGRQDQYTYVTGDFTGRADDYNIVKLDAVPLTTGALKRIDASFYAGNYGVIGDGVADDTAAANAFLELCRVRQRTAYFGGLRVKTTAALTATNTGIVFDQWAYGEGAPGIYPTGSGYTALTMLGAVSDCVVSIIGSGTVAVDGKVLGSGDAVTGGAGTITTDTRPQINGIAFGSIAQENPLLASTVRSARVYKLGGFGIKCYAWDTTFLSLSTELCGKNDTHAFVIDGDVTHTSNECNFVRIQVELSAGRAIYIAPQTLSCTFGKVHAERTYGRPNDVVCQWGPGNYSAIRLSTTNGNGSALVLAQSGSFTGYRPEGIATDINSTGGAVEFISAESGTYRPASTSNGAVTFVGGMANWSSATQNWRAVGVAMPICDIGDCPDGYFAALTNCRVASLTRSGGAAAVRITDGRVDALAGGQWRHISIGGSARIALASGAQTFTNMKMNLDAGSILTGNITLNNVGARMAGRVIGDYSMTGQRATLFAASAEVSGTLTNNGPPTDGAYLDGFTEGMFCKNLRPAVLGNPAATYTVKDTSNVNQTITTGGQYIIAGWQRAQSDWRDCRVLIGT